MRIRLLLGIGASAMLLACGGGGDKDETVVASGSSASTSTPSASSPAPVTPAATPPQGAMPGSGGTGFASSPSSPPPLEPIVQSADNTREVGVPVASGPISSACPQTPDEARNAATRNEFGQIIGIPACMTRPDPMTASEQQIATWNAICQTARCLVVAGRLP